jgi:preprotein translocase subunit SecF
VTDTTTESTDDAQAADDEAVADAQVTAQLARAARQRSSIGPFRRLYRGLTTFDFVGRKRTWFAISAAIIIIGMSALGIKGLNLGIDFKGGSTWTITAPGVTQQQAVNAIGSAVPSPVIEILAGKTIQVQSNLASMSAKQQTAAGNKVIAALLRLAHLPAKDVNAVSTNFVGPTWGSEITTKAIQALIAFFIAVVAYISIRFEPKMALAAFLAMLHDLAVTVGIYAIFGFQVTPDTVIAVLTILGYSLYDTVVVFDRVRDNTKPFAASGRMTYSAMVNLSMNQTLARSINTSMVAILPVLSVLLVGAELLGAITLQSYGVALTVGLLSGAYSSIFIASPLLAIMKEREQKYRAVRTRLHSKGERLISMSAQDAARFSMSAPSASTGATGRLATAPRGPRTTRPPRPTSPAPGKPPTSTPVVPSAPLPSTQTQQSTPIIQPRARKQKKR